jgi:hypothetical protein
MLASMGRCPHTPVHRWDPAMISREVERVKRMLRGEDWSIVERMTTSMRQASAEMDFERAARYRDLMQKLSAFFERWKYINGAGVRSEQHRDRSKESDACSFSAWRAPRAGGPAWMRRCARWSLRKASLPAESREGGSLLEGGG